MGELFYYDTKNGVIDISNAGAENVTRDWRIPGKKLMRFSVDCVGLDNTDGTIVAKASVDGVNYIDTLATITLNSANLKANSDKLDVAGYAFVRFIYTKNSNTKGTIVVSLHATR